MDEQCFENDNQMYKLLNDGQIRVFRLLPGNFDDPIKGSLEVVSLDDRPEYVAISYVWGIDLSSELLLIDGKELVSTRNLEVALRHLRNSVDSNVSWIDAICINQADMEEKAEQVKLMGRIFEMSATVLIWLGPGTEQTDEVMRYVFSHDKKAMFDEKEGSEVLYYFSIPRYLHGS